MSIGLPTPNIARFPTQTASSRVWGAMPTSVQNMCRVRGAKVFRMTLVGNKPSEILTGDLGMVVCLWLLFLFSGKDVSEVTSTRWLGSWVLPSREGLAAVGQNFVDYVTPNSRSRYKIVDSPRTYVQAGAPLAPPSSVIDLTNESLISEEEWAGIQAVLEREDDLPNPRHIRGPVHQRYLTLATMLKNQRRWLREWIEFHLMIGVEHFIIYDNESTDHPLEILQHYVDQGVATYIPWPPRTIPRPTLPFKTGLEKWQYSWFKDSLETCLSNDWSMHRQGPCQLAAFEDAILRTNKGVSRWLGIWDVDEYIFPREKSNFKTLTGLLRRKYSDVDHIRFYGNMFGTNGHIEHARRKPGSPIQALLTEEYVLRAELDHHGEYPFEQVGADGWVVEGKGQLGSFRFGGADMHARKSVVDPDFASHSWIHHFEADGAWGFDKEELIWVDSDDFKFNHYAFLSQEESRRKAEVNRNPFMNFSAEIDEFFSRERDTEVHYLLPELKERILKTIMEDPPVHPDDYEGSWDQV